MSKTFCPMLCPNEQIDLDKIPYPQLASFKLDGIRCIFHPTLGMVSRSLKPIPNKQLNEKFAHITEFSKVHNIILDGELYAHGRTFQDITRACMTDDLWSVDTLKKLKKETEEPTKYVDNLINVIEFFMFDIIIDDVEFEKRFIQYKNLDISHIIGVGQVVVNNKQDVLDRFIVAQKEGYEGLILKNPNGKYKFGRATVKENLCYKVKPFIDFSRLIKGVVQATQVKDGTERTINELGHSVTSKKKDDRELIDKASAFIVDWNGQDLKVTIAATDIEKEEIWSNREDYIGKEVNFKAMEIGMKDLPRHPTTTRYWKKDE